MVASVIRLLLLVLCTRLFASEVESRYVLSTSHDPFASLSYSGSSALPQPLDLRLGTRITVSNSIPDRADAVAEAAYTFLSIFSLHLRLHHGLLLGDTASVTHLVPSLRASYSPFSLFEVFAELGWYFRFIRVHKVVVVPTFVSDAIENDVATVFGLRFFPPHGHEVTVSCGTMDSFDTYNLNNPFVELRAGRIGYTFLGVSPNVFFRYQLLLGFGRYDSLTFGFQTHFM